jgi:hypothetical protein
MNCDHVFMVTGYDISKHSLMAKEFTCRKCLAMLDPAALSEIRHESDEEKKKFNESPSHTS